MDSCPGRRSADISSVDVSCPSCGAVVEMFSDEQKARCRCGKIILREALPSCAMWCPAADRCLGAVIDLRSARQRAQNAHLASDCDDYVDQIRRRIGRSRGGGRAAAEGAGGDSAAAENLPEHPGAGRRSTREEQSHDS